MHADSPGLNLKCPLQARVFEHLAQAGGGHLGGCGAWLGEAGHMGGPFSVVAWLSSGLCPATWSPKI